MDKRFFVFVMLFVFFSGCLNQSDTASNLYVREKILPSYFSEFTILVIIPPDLRPSFDAELSCEYLKKNSGLIIRECSYNSGKFSVLGKRHLVPHRELEVNDKFPYVEMSYDASYGVTSLLDSVGLSYDLRKSSRYPFHNAVITQFIRQGIYEVEMLGSIDETNAKYLKKTSSNMIFRIEDLVDKNQGEKFVLSARDWHNYVVMGVSTILLLMLIGIIIKISDHWWNFSLKKELPLSSDGWKNRIYEDEF